MHNCTHEKDFDRVRALGNDIFHSANASTLKLLQAVDITVNALASLQKVYGDFERTTRQAADSIKGCKPTKLIDADSAICDVLNHAEGALHVQHEILNKGLNSALSDPQLHGENKEAVVQEYMRSISASADLHNAMVDLRWAIMEHDADLSPVSGSFSNADELINHLNRL